MCVIRKNSRPQRVSDSRSAWALEFQRRRSVPVLLLVSSWLLATPVLAAPEGGHITVGSGSIVHDGANLTQINQNSNILSIDWQSFDVSAQETVRFVQPSRNAAALNRIFDQRPSEIFGRIEANGRVFLINPNGIVFGAGAVVNVGALVATSLNLDMTKLNAADYRLYASDGRTPGAIINRGVITAASGGSVSLIGARVENSGQILADYGQIHLAAGRQAYLSFDNTGLLNFSVSGDVGDNDAQATSAVENSGSLLADGGSVLLTANAASEVFTNVVNNSGLVRAHRIENVGGVITLRGSGGNVVHSGRLDAQGRAGSSGGSISVSGDRVGIFDRAVIDVSGDTGGGSLRIGGRAADTQTVATTFTQIAAQTDIRADAMTSGNGGDIRIWAEDFTWAHGSISARGGAQGGDGGFVEISALKGISYTGSVDLRAAPDSTGKTGSLLFDPTDIVIWDQADGAQADDGALPDLSNATVGAGNFNIGELALEGLASNANIILEATNNITLNNLADNRLNLATDSTASITLTADSDADGNGSFVMDSGDSLVTAGGDISITAATITAGDLISNAGGADGAVTLSATGSVAVGSIDAGTQSIAVTIDSDGNAAETLSLGGTLSGSGGINLTGGSNGGDTLIGPNGNNSWTITSLNTGTINGADYSSFTNLQGGSADDSFAITGIGSISGLIDGGAHIAGDRVDYSGSTGVVNVTLGSSVANIEFLVGGGADNTLNGGNTANTWNITGANDGTVAGISFTDFFNLTGGTADDRFILSNGSINGTITGGGGTDSLTGNNTSNTWSVQSADGGTVDNVFAFVDIDTLIGGDGADIFILNGGTVSGQIDGGIGNDSLSADTVANTWNITAADAGDVDGVAAFVRIENLNGKSDTDDFLFSVTGSISGTVDGGAGIDSVNLSALPDPVVADLSGSDYANIERFVGNNTDSTLIGPVAQNAWVIDGSNDGTLGAISFVDFTNLTGNTDDDTFTFSSGGTLAGTINGGAGNDSLTGDNSANSWDIAGLDAGVLNGTAYLNIENLVGNIDVDNFTFADGSGVSGTVDGRDGVDTVDFSAETGVVNVQLGFAGFSNIEFLTGNDTDSSLIAESGVNDWTISRINGGLLNGSTSFSAFNQLIGNSGDDTFTISGGSITGSISGGGGNDTLIGDSINNTWAISGANSGSTANVAAFSAITNLTGNSGDDNFVFADGSSISGVINGASGNDTLDQSAQTGAVSISLASTNVISIENFIGNGANSTLVGDDVDSNWRITSANSGSVNNINFTNFANLTGGSGVDNFALAGGDISGAIVGGGGNDELVANNSTNSWRITGTDVGTVNGQNAFSSVERLFGGTLSDTFVYDNGSSFSGGVDGGGGTDEVDMSAQVASVNIVLGSNTFSNIESYVGNNIDSTLSGGFSSNTWRVTGLNSGTVNTISFAGFNHLVGNIQTDSFSITSGSITGSIDGNDGNDNLTASATNNTWNITSVNGGDVTNVASFVNIENLIGNTGTDIFVFGNTSDITGTVDGAAGIDTVDFSAVASTVSVLLGVSGYLNIESFIGNDIDSTLTGPALANNWQITGINDGSVAGVTFTNFNNLNGNVTSDTFTFANGSQIVGSVDGGAGLDTADFSAVTNVVTVQLGGAGFSNIETFIGNDVSSTIVGDAVSNNWLISGANDGTLGNISFFNFNNILGNSAVDTFTLNGGSISGSLDGAAGSDTLVADNAANIWNITAIDTGTVTGVNRFVGIENLRGNIDTDTFAYADGARMSGSVDGSAGFDTVDFSAQTGAVAVDLGGSSYLNIENYVGNNIDSTLTGANSANSWIVNGVNSGTVGTVSFSAFTRLQGNAQADTFAINGGSISAGIDGGTGTDSLNVQTGTTTWNITGTNIGDLNGAGGFSNIELLIGNANADQFVFANGASFSGLIDGAGGADIVDHSSQAGVVQILLGGNAYTSIETFIGNNVTSTLVADSISNDWQITAQNAGRVNGINFQGFNNISGNSSVDNFTLSGGSISGQVNGGGGNDTIIAADIANAWSLTSADSGSVTGINAFADIDNLTGGALVDTFTLTARLSGNLSAAGGDDVITLAGGGASVGGIIRGNTGTDTLRGPDIDNTWAITDGDAGTLNTSSFAEIENLVGGTRRDDFSVSNSAAAALSGTIDAGSGDDTLTIAYNAANTRRLDFDGNAGNDRVLVTGGGSGFANLLTLGVGGLQGSLVTSGVGASQTVAVQNIETLQDSLTADRVRINGSSSNDAWQLDSGTLSADSPATLTTAGSLRYDFANKTDVTISGEGGSDTLTLGSDVSFDGNLTLTMETIQNTAAATLGANRLTLDQVASGGSAAAVIRSDVASIDITGTSGNIYLREVDDVLLSASNVSGRLAVTSTTGDIGSNGSLRVAGSSQFTVADGGSIVLDNTANSFASTPDFQSTGSLANVSFSNDTGIAIQPLTLTGDLTLRANGAITQTGPLSIAGNSNFNAGAGSISLTNTANALTGSVSLNNTGNQAVTLFNSTALVLSTSNVGTGTLSLIADGVSQIGPLLQASNAGAVTINAGSGSIALANGSNDFTGQVTLTTTGASDIAITDASQLRLAATTTNGGNIIAAAANGIVATETQQTNGGDISFTAGGGDIDLGRLNANSGGTITLTAATGAINGNNSPITDANLNAQHLRLTSGTTMGNFNNPIAVNVPRDGTSLFIVGDGSANIIGLPGIILPGSSNVNNVSTTVSAVGQAQMTAIDTLPLFYLRDDDKYRQFSILNGGVRMPEEM